MVAGRFLLRIRSYSHTHRLLYSIALMLLFWSLFDGIISYTTPLIITGEGYSNTAMGLIYATSSISGATFDLILSKVLRNTYFRRLYLMMFIICFAYPLLLWNAKSLPLYLITMAIWGIYYDLKNFGTYDFISRYSTHNDHASSFGVIGIFRIAGYLSAPIIAGMVISETLNPKPLYLAIFFLLISFSFMISILLNVKHNHKLQESNIEKSLPERSSFAELNLLKKISRLLIPVLCVAFFVNLQDAFFWTLGPLYSHDSQMFDNFGGVFISAYLLPSIFAYTLVGKLTQKIGKKKTAFISIILGSAFLCLLWFDLPPTLLLLTILISSFFSSWAWPAMDGAFADYLSETQTHDKEVSSLADLFFNLGWIVGPFSAGLLSDLIGLEKAFAFIGVVGLLLGLLLIRFSPKHIRVP